MIIKMIILKLLGSSDDKEKIGVARPEGSPLQVTIGITMDVKIGGATSFEKGGACSNKGRYAKSSWCNTLSLVNFFCSLLLVVMKLLGV